MLGGSSNSISIIYFNCQSIVPKFDELVCLCLAHKPSIVCLTEAWLCSDIVVSSSCKNHGIYTCRLTSSNGNCSCILVVMVVLVSVVVLVVIYSHSGSSGWMVANCSCTSCTGSSDCTSWGGCDARTSCTSSYCTSYGGCDGCKYTNVRQDRNRRGGGVAIYINNAFSFKVLLSGPSDLELFAKWQTW